MLVLNHKLKNSTIQNLSKPLSSRAPWRAVGQEISPSDAGSESPTDQERSLQSEASQSCRSAPPTPSVVRPAITACINIGNYSIYSY